MPKVTVCIAVYNGEETLARSLDSVFAQTYKDFNVLVLDDGSKDRSAEIALQYPVKLIRQENHGLGYARMRMIEEADGELIAYNDHDDIWLPNKLEVQVPEHDRAGCVLSYTGGEWVQSDGTIKIRDDYPLNPVYSFDHILPMNHVIGISALFNREAMLKGGNIDPEVKIGSDLYGWYMLAPQGSFHYVPERTVRYYIREGQNTTPGYKYYEADRFLYEERILPRFEELFASVPEPRKSEYKRMITKYLGRNKRALAHAARVEKKDRQLALRFHRESIRHDPTHLGYWGSYLKNLFRWRPGEP